jgi:phosphate transport system substrate-binding protein
MTRRSSALWRLLALMCALVLVLAACGGDDDDDDDASGGDGGGDLSGEIAIDGSSTVAPLSETAAEDFMAENSGVQITVGTSGTGGGFEKFCNGETDISDASRPIHADDEAEGIACEANGITYTELQIANDGLSVVVNPENDWVECLTVEQLAMIWGPDADGTVTNWNQVDPSYPDVPLELFGPGTDSGTFDFFTDVINGEEGASRTDYTATEDDNVTVQGVSGSEGGIGYFGLSYYEENSDSLKLVEVDGGDGCVAPSVETVQDGSYTPLSRPLFIYPSGAILQTDYGAAFVEYYLDNAVSIAETALFVPLTDEQQQEAIDASNALKEEGGGTSETTAAE